MNCHLELLDKSKSQRIYLLLRNPCSLQFFEKFEGTIGGKPVNFFVLRLLFLKVAILRSIFCCSVFKLTVFEDFFALAKTKLDRLVRFLVPYD